MMKKTILLSCLLWPVLSWADECELVINSNDQMQFDQKELQVPASCDDVKLTLNHTGQLPANVMGHNWVLSKAADFQAIAQAGMTAKDNNYVPVGDDRVIANTTVIGGGESTSITFSIEGLDAAADYTFFCSFPGHWAIMKGTFKII